MPASQQQPALEYEGELEDGYDEDYDEFDEDTMDVEDIPEDADFEWCWDEDGRMKIEEINKVSDIDKDCDIEDNAQDTEDEADSKQGQPAEVKTGFSLLGSEKMSGHIFSCSFFRSISC